MWIALAAALVALLCVLASARRLAWAIAPIGLEPRSVLEALEGDRGEAVFRALREAIASDERFSWERDLFAAFDEPEGPRRDAILSEQLLDLEARAGRAARVPRVCASIATSAGLLFGSIALLEGLAAPEGGDATGALSSALGAVALGIAGTAFCVAVHVRAARVARVRRAAIGELVERLQRLHAPGGGEGGGTPGAGVVQPRHGA